MNASTSTAVLNPPSLDPGPAHRVQYLRVPVSGGRIMHVTVFGPDDGLATVALHGLGGSTEQNLPALQAVAEHYRLRTYAIDLPGHGRSSAVGIFEFDVRHFAELVLETVRGLDIDTAILFGHSFGGQLAALVAEDLTSDSLQAILVNPAIGEPWDLKLRRCWRRPWLFLKLLEELGYNDGNITRGEIYHAGMLLRSLRDLVLDRHLRPYRRLQVTLALLRNCDTASILGRLTQRGIVPVIIHGSLDHSIPANDGVHFVDGFHDWLHEATGPQTLVAALNAVFPAPLAR